MIATPTMHRATEKELMYRGAAMAQLYILRQEMKLGGLKIGSRRVKLSDDVEIFCNICFNAESVQVVLPHKNTNESVSSIPGPRAVYPLLIYTNIKFTEIWQGSLADFSSLSGWLAISYPVLHGGDDVGYVQAIAVDKGKGAVIARMLNMPTTLADTAQDVYFADVVKKYVDGNVDLPGAYPDSPVVAIRDFRYAINGSVLELAVAMAEISVSTEDPKFFTNITLWPDRRSLPYAGSLGFGGCGVYVAPDGKKYFVATRRLGDGTASIEVYSNLSGAESIILSANLIRSPGGVMPQFSDTFTAGGIAAGEYVYDTAVSIDGTAVYVVRKARAIVTVVDEYWVLVNEEEVLVDGAPPEWELRTSPPRQVLLNGKEVVKILLNFSINEFGSLQWSPTSEVLTNYNAGPFGMVGHYVDGEYVEFDPYPYSTTRDKDICYIDTVDNELIVIRRSTLFEDFTLFVNDTQATIPSYTDGLDANSKLLWDHRFAEEVLISYERSSSPLSYGRSNVWYDFFDGSGVAKDRPKFLEYDYVDGYSTQDDIQLASKFLWPRYHVMLVKPYGLPPIGFVNGYGLHRITTQDYEEPPEILAGGWVRADVPASSIQTATWTVGTNNPFTLSDVPPDFSVEPPTGQNLLDKNAVAIFGICSSIEQNLYPKED